MANVMNDRMEWLRRMREAKVSRVGGGGESRPALKSSTDISAGQARQKISTVMRKQSSDTGGAASEVLKAPIAGVASGPPKSYRYRDPEKRRKYMRELMQKKRAK